MDVKKTDIKNRVKEFFSGYMGIYFEDIPKTREEIKEKMPFLLKETALCVINCLLGYYFGSMTVAYSAIPLGTAYLCSAKKYAGFVYIGLAISAATERTGMALPLFLIYTALFIARVLVYRTFGMKDEKFRVFNEGIVYKLVEGFSASLFISVYRAAVFGFLYYDIFGGIFEVLAVPLFITLYDFAFNERHKFTVKREIGMVALLGSVLLGLRGIYFYGMSLGLPVAVLITMYMSRSAGVMRGGIYGLVCGFIINPVLSPVIASMGMAAGVLWKYGNAAALSVACFTGIACSVYVEGWESLTLYVPEFLCACILFFPLAQFGWLPHLKLYTEGIKPADDTEGASLLAEKRHRDTERRINDLARAFADLSEVFYTLSDRTSRPGIIDARQLCDGVCDAYCPKCLFKGVCWEKEYSSSSDVFSKISKALCDNGYVERSDVPDYMLERCRNMDRILERINTDHADLLESMIKENKTEVFAMDYESMAHLLTEAVKVNCYEYLPDENIRKRLLEMTKQIRFNARNICVYGKRKISVIAGGVDVFNTKLTSDQIRECFENVCGVKLTTPVFEVEGDYVTMSLECDRRFAVEYAAASNTKREEKYCGDLICMFENKNDYFYSLISDGMGSGREAALTSRLCGIFMKKMLTAGNSKPVAMEMLNNFIRSKNTECFSTVDLLEIDLLNGTASFVKSGAVASYVLRKDKLFRIASNTMPVGITKMINAEEVKFELEDGDVIVMVSDGVGQSSEDTVRVSNILVYSWEDDLDKMAEKILHDAVSSATRSDDVSVGLIRVKAI